VQFTDDPANANSSASQHGWNPSAARARENTRLQRMEQEARRDEQSAERD